MKDNCNNYKIVVLLSPVLKLTYTNRDIGRKNQKHNILSEVQSRSGKGVDAQNHVLTVKEI